MPQPTATKKDAIIAIGLDKPTSEIIAMAAGQGVKVSKTYVDLLKQRSGARAKTPKKSVTASKNKRAAKKPTKRGAARRRKKAGGPAVHAPSQSKAAYVRDFPASTKAAEIVAQGKDAGLKLTTAYVYKVRGKSGPASGDDTRATKPSVRAATPRKPEAGQASPDVDSAFRAAVLTMVLEDGLPAARARFEDVVAKVLAAVAAV